MNDKHHEIRLRSILLHSFILNLIFSIPILGFLTIFGLLKPQIVPFFFFFISIIWIPLSSSLLWLMAKGSNWENTTTAMKINGGVAGQFYCVLLGGLLGYKFLGMIGGIVMTVIFFLTGSFAGYHLGKYLMYWFNDVKNHL